jgi:diguanylate cyclase (GGDEF)-like protein
VELLTTFGASGFPLRDIQLFHDAADPNVERLLADCKVMRVEAGETLLDGSGNSGRLYILLRGALEARTPDLHGGLADGASVHLAPGECVGELSVLDDEAQATTVTALEKSDVLMIEGARLWRLIDECNGVARNLLRLLSFRLRAANARLRRNQKVGEFFRQLSFVDGLTGLQNRAWLDQQLPTLIEHAVAAQNPLSIIMVDIDHFKKFNDEYGHQAGDDVLQATAHVLRQALRPRDFAARYGGEELMLILPNTHQKSGMGVAQRLCENLRETVFFQDMHKPLPHITASFGIASLAPGQDAAALIATADAALYRAKHAGRNQVAV